MERVGQNEVEREVNVGIKVMVHYVAAGYPFEDDDADRAETVGHLKSRVLAEFGLAEGQLPDGNVATFTLYHGHTPLENMSQTLGELAGEQKVLQLKLNQQITQGNAG